MQIRIVFFLFVLPYSLLLAQSWQLETVGTLPFYTSNNAVCSGVFNDTAFVFSFGGIDTLKTHQGIHRKCARYNTITGTVIQIDDLPDTLGKIASAASTIGDTIYIMGGYHVFSNGHEVSSNKVHRYVISQNAFIADGAPIPVPIDDHVQGVYKNRYIYLITGWSNTTNKSDVQIYDTHTNTWQAGTAVPNTNIYKSFGSSGVIIGDTIYYYGGARMGFNFPIQNNLRIGVINQNDPTQIQWSDTTFTTGLYRTAAVNFQNNPLWLGGSLQTFNYNGLSYQNNTIVDPSNLIASYNPISKTFTDQTLSNLPFDLRGVGETQEGFYFLGGMIDSARVSNQILKLWFGFPTRFKDNRLKTTPLTFYPNPTQGMVYFNEELNSVRVYNTKGECLFQTSPQNKMLDLQFLKPSVYILSTHTKNARLIIE